MIMIRMCMIISVILLSEKIAPGKFHILHLILVTNIMWGTLRANLYSSNYFLTVHLLICFQTNYTHKDHIYEAACEAHECKSLLCAKQVNSTGDTLYGCYGRDCNDGKPAPSFNTGRVPELTGADITNHLDSTSCFKKEETETCICSSNRCNGSTTKFISIQITGISFACALIILFYLLLF